MRALDTLRDVIGMANASDTCPCGTMPVARIDGAKETVEQLLAELSGALDMIAVGDVNGGTEHAGHVLVIAMQVGYIVGAGDAYDVTLSTEIVVPDTLAMVDFIDPRGRE